MVEFKLKYWIAGILSFFSFIVIVLILNEASKQPIPKYRVEGYVRVIKRSNNFDNLPLYNSGFDTITSNSVWLIDSFRIIDGKVTYTNRNGYVTRINPPYKIYEYLSHNLIDEK